MKITQLPQSCSNSIEINAYAKSVKGVHFENAGLLVDFLVKKFSKKKWVSMSKNGSSINFTGKKKRDLGCDSLEVKIIGEKFIKHVQSFSNTNDKVITYFKIQA